AFVFACLHHHVVCSGLLPCVESICMPELPEVETTLRGLAPHLVGQRIHGVILRRPDLRWPIAEQIEQLLPGATITDVRRRAKYLLMDTDAGG
ncbi:DNA-formamidopyrimidine glycosylase family protein, partial [Pseudomonas viridiflava]|uniref:DNA-formamidopyrimidine glycosylase family protein n=1 Tax=Pseudomonas viridiflava TaxID=33069 RepID=UPI002402ABD7